MEKYKYKSRHRSWAGKQNFTESLDKAKKILEDKKYYTPTLEELLTFIVNEKYCYTTGKTNKNVIFEIDFRKPNLVHNLQGFIDSNDYDQDKGYSVNPELYLLKYLDKEDIESLGFETEFDKLMKVIFTILRRDRPANEIYFDYNTENHSIKIHDIDDILFKGTIKNISELKVILKQIGITK